ncbi:phage head morphogenesis protein [Galactobacter valiniphilus]|uniref:Phage head morphogenesis protein n=1 Tax=Galactobacter valiniphilus TaxID=2676122 RepID=A0A399J9H5_9MICC|nr:phage minor head protein [Galactobacter valiniphilus]RII41884.1 phage head morphogenesis protein [Galactobacter valiniphilus]
MAITEDTLRVAAATRARLINATREQELAITRAWADAWDLISPELLASLLDLMVRYAQDGRVPRHAVAKDARLRAALAQVRATIKEVAKTTGESAAAIIPAEVSAAGPDLEASVRTQLPAGSTLPVAHPAPDALDAIVMRTQQRIHSQYRALSAESVAAMRAELVRGIAVGDNPRTVARRIMDRTEGAFNGGISRASTIARTEILDAYRAASRHASQANTEILAGRRWTAELGPRTCASCIGRHGRMYPPGTDGPWDHPNGRCCFTDVTKTWAELGLDGVDEPEPVWRDRDAWWDNLTPESQDRMIGRARAQLLHDGKVRWEDLSHFQQNVGWRDSLRLRPLHELLVDEL